MRGDLHGAREVGTSTLPRLYQMFMDCYDSLKDPSIAEILVPLAYEQFPHQGPVFAELARTAALLLDEGGDREWPWHEIFGMPLTNMVRAAMIVHTWVASNGGRWDPALLDMEHFQEVFERAAPRDEIVAAIRYLSVTLDEARAHPTNSIAVPRQFERYRFNPLSSKPLVDLGPTGVWAPVVSMVIRSISVGNIYYPAIRAWGSDFSNDLGLRTENYVGRLLRLVGQDRVLAQIIWGKPEHRSVDFIWVTDGAVILIESKSARMSLAGRTDMKAMAKTAERYLVEGRKQIDATADVIRQKHPAFASIPNDRPIVGLVVTSEPFYLGNALIPENGRPSETPSHVVSLAELEQLVCYEEDQIVPELLELARDPKQREWSMATTFMRLPTPKRNPILDRAYKRFDLIDPRHI